ncbi:hypothetical protein ACLHZX_16800, partial [Aeromonas media]
GEGGGGTGVGGDVRAEGEGKRGLGGRGVIGGESIVLTVPRTSLAPKKAVDFLSDKPIEIELEGELLALDGETAPFYVDRPVTV